MGVLAARWPGIPGLACQLRGGSPERDAIVRRHICAVLDDAHIPRGAGRRATVRRRAVGDDTAAQSRAAHPDAESRVWWPRALDGDDHGFLFRRSLLAQDPKW